MLNNVFMQPSMGILTLPCPRVVKHSASTRRRIFTYKKIEVGWIFTLFIFGRSESAPYLSVGYGESLPNHANCIRQCVNLRLKT